VTAPVPLQPPPAHDHVVRSPAGRLQRPEALPALVGTGLVAGAVWGVAARAWMRTVSDVPEFTWVGSAMIVALAALAGVGLALVEAFRASGAGAARFLPVVLTLPLFAGPGLVLLPGALLAGFALSGRGPRWLAVVTAGAAQLPTALMALDLPFVFAPYPVILQVGGFAVLVLALGAGWRTVFLPRVRPALTP
jgi:hypothetical protein